MVIQLDFFNSQPLAEPVGALSQVEFDEMVARQDLADVVYSKGYCDKCYLREVCDSDDCGRHGFRLYSKCEPK